MLHSIYKKIFTEDRLLNKNGSTSPSRAEKNEAMMKMKKEFRKVARETIHLRGENIDDDKDEEIKNIFNHNYSNMDNMEWLIKKGRLLKNSQPKMLNLK